jgi:uncharacterized membrane protein YgcG
MSVSTARSHNRIGWSGLALLLAALVALLPALAGAQDEPESRTDRRVQTQNTPAPKPDEVPALYNGTHLFTDAQLRTLEMDAFRLTSIKIPVLVYVRVADSDYADVDSTQTFADAVRADWDIASAPGADDGLVLLLTLDKQGEHGHSLTLSYGTETFAHSGLTPAYIYGIFEDQMRPLLEDGHYFDALSIGMRRIRYGGIYFPPPVATLEGAAATVHDTLAWLGPLGVMALTGIFIALSLRVPMDDPARRPLVRRIGVAVGLLAVALAALAVFGRSALGVASALLIAISLAIQLWVWTRPRAVPRPLARQRAVPPASRRVRRWAQAKRMALGATEARR